MHLAHQIVGLQHAAHAQCQTQRNAHGQTFGHGHHHEGDGYHEVVQNVLYVVEVPNLSSVEEDLGGEYQEGQCGYGVARLADDAGQTFQLQLQGSVQIVVHLCTLIHFAVFCGIAYGHYLHYAVSVHHGCATHYVVGRVGGFCVELGLYDSLGNQWLASQCGLVHLQRDGFQQDTVGRNLIAGAKHDDISHHDVCSGGLADVPVAYYRHGNVVVHLIQYLKGLGRLGFEKETYGACQHYGKEDAHGLDEGLQALLVGAPAMNGRDDHGQHPGKEQDANDGVFKLLQKLNPERSLLRWCEYVRTVFQSTVLHLLRGESLVQVFLFHRTSVCLGYVSVVVGQGDYLCLRL